MGRRTSRPLRPSWFQLRSAESGLLDRRLTGEHGRSSLWLASVALFAFALLYLSLGSTLTLEWTDEGMIVYPAWRVAHGDLPYRDFHHVYGPSLHFLNGVLLHLFGDLLAIRASLVVIKALIAVCVFLLSCRVARARVALSISLGFLAVYGTPFWVFNTPYANHHGLLPTLAAFLFYLSYTASAVPEPLPAGVGKRSVTSAESAHSFDPPHPAPAPFTSGKLPRLFVAGFCFGLATSFKQTLGAFYIIAFVLALMLEEQAGRARALAPARTSRARITTQIAVALVLLGALALCLAYVGKHLPAWSSVILLTPLLAGIAVTALGESKLPRADSALLAKLVVLGLGVALPLVGYALFFLAEGALGSLAFGMFSGLPRLIDWYVPPPAPRLQSIVLGVVFASLLGTAHSWARYGAQVATAKWMAGSLAAVVLAVGAVVAGMRFRIWALEMSEIFRWLPIVLVWAALAPVLSGAARRPVDPAKIEIRFFWLLAAGSLVQLHPAADLPHVAFVAPASLPLLAHYVERFLTVGAESRLPRSRSAVPSLAILILTAGLVLPCVWILARTSLARPRSFDGFSRATHIWSHGQTFIRAVELVRFLESRDEGEMLVLANQQMLYFLAGRRSTLTADEFLLYLVGADVISDANARALIDEERIVERLRRQRPLIIDTPGTKPSLNFRRTFPTVARHIESEYAPLARFGEYEVLSPRDSRED